MEQPPIDVGLPARIEPEPLPVKVPEKPKADPKTSAQLRVVEVSEALVPAYQKASMLSLQPEQEQGLMASFPEEAVEIRPDGLLYIPHATIRDRLNQVLGPGKWCLIRRSEWYDGEAKTMYGEYVMVVHGCFVGEAVGDALYNEQNAKTNYGDALESTAGVALRRIAAKALSCGSQVWNPEYCRQWMAKYAQKNTVRDWKGKMVDRWVKSVPKSESSLPAESAPTKSVRAASNAKLEWMAACKAKLVSLLSATPDTEAAAIEYFRAQGLLLDNEGLADLAPQSLWPGMDMLAAVSEADKRIVAEKKDEYVNAIAATMDAKPVAPKPAEKPIEKAIEVPRDPEAKWKSIRVPQWSKHAKEYPTFGDLPKNLLWWWCMKWEPKGWTDKAGNSHMPAKSDIELRRMLDFVKGEYDFSDGGQEGGYADE